MKRPDPDAFATPVRSWTVTGALLLAPIASFGSACTDDDGAGEGAAETGDDDDDDDDDGTTGGDDGTTGDDDGTTGDDGGTTGDDDDGTTGHGRGSTGGEEGSSGGRGGSTGGDELVCESVRPFCTEADPCACVGCVDDDVCEDGVDDCVCNDCNTAAFCGGDTCEDDGVCNPYYEGCACADCFGHPECDEFIGGNACTRLIAFELQPSDATLSGGWELGMSMVGEGEIAVLPDPTEDASGSILFEPDVPCDDTWYIWVRYWEDGSDDSYFATLDGMPMPAAVFEGDCTGGGSGYDWAVLNWRDEADRPCTYVENPWAPSWDAGIHEIEFSYREAQAMGRILLTNDPGFVPG